MGDGRGEDWDFELELSRIDESAMGPYERIEALQDWALSAVYELKSLAAQKPGK